MPAASLRARAAGGASKAVRPRKTPDRETSRESELISLRIVADEEVDATAVRRIDVAAIRRHHENGRAPIVRDSEDELVGHGSGEEAGAEGHAVGYELVRFLKE